MSSSREGFRTGMRAVVTVHVWIVAALIPALDRLLTLERMVRLLTPRGPFRPYRGVTADGICGIVRRRLERSRQMRRRACLRTSLVLYHFLLLAGIDAVFHVAVFPPSADPKRLHAHSWVTVGPQCVCEPPGEGAAEMFTYGRTEGTGLQGHASV